MQPIKVALIASYNKIVSENIFLLDLNNSPLRYTVLISVLLNLLNSKLNVEHNSSQNIVSKLS